MSQAQLKYYNDQELQSATFDWSNAGYDFSTGWTFNVRLCRSTAPATTLLYKTTGITATATTITVAWTTTDWAGLEAAVNGTPYVLHLYARRTADSKDLVFAPGTPTTLTLYAAAGTSAVSPSSYPITVTAASVTLADTANYFAATNVEDALAEHMADTVDAHDASAISFVPTGTIAATDVQTAIAEVATEAATAATTSVSGIVELATNAEALARTDAVRAVTPANLSQFTTVNRYVAQRGTPTAALAQSIPRWAVNNTSSTVLVSGRQQFYRIWLTTGTVNSITFVSGAAGATTPTNQWFSIYDANRNKLAVTADDTTTAWGASSAKTLTISGGYTISTEGDYYIGIMVAATTVPQLAIAASAGSIAVFAPVIAGSDNTNTGLTTPATAPAIAAALSSAGSIAYCYVS